MGAAPPSVLPPQTGSEGAQVFRDWQPVQEFMPVTEAIPRDGPLKGGGLTRWDPTLCRNPSHAGASRLWGRMWGTVAVSATGVCKTSLVWRPIGDSNPCYHRERARTLGGWGEAGSRWRPTPGISDLLLPRRYPALQRFLAGHLRRLKRLADPKRFERPAFAFGEKSFTQRRR